jgi:pyrimidine-nucleoside phosphorylase
MTFVPLFELETGAASTRILDAISQKRSCIPLEEAQVHKLVEDFVSGQVPDYQMAAWLATVACVGMDFDELKALTSAYVGSGDRMRCGEPGCFVVDKHSTGGVGDKVTLVVVPIVAACGVAVAKLSGRGLGFAGGTIDKLEAISGLRLDLSPAEIRSTVSKVGMAISGHSLDLAPGDDATYALRDVTGTVDSIPLIAASIISKKVATGADGLVLDVKTGSGALLGSDALTRELAGTMVKLAESFGLRCRAFLSDMNQPLGHAVGNALEVKEALRALSGEYVPGLSELSVALSTAMLQTAEPDLSEMEAAKRIDRVLGNGAAHEQFIRWATMQGGDASQLEKPERLPKADNIVLLKSSRSGWVTAVRPRPVGTAALRVGAGRLQREAQIDPAAGVVVLKRVGDRVEAGETLAEVHCSRADPDEALMLLRTAFEFEDAPALNSSPPICQELTGHGVH